MIALWASVAFECCDSLSWLQCLEPEPECDRGSGRGGGGNGGGSGDSGTQPAVAAAAELVNGEAVVMAHSVQSSGRISAPGMSPSLNS